MMTAPDAQLELEQRLREDMDTLALELFHLAAQSSVLADVKAFASISAAAQLAIVTAEAVPWLAPRLAEALVAAAQALQPALIVVDLSGHDGPTH